jgi:hypothetical protein
MSVELSSGRSQSKAAAPCRATILARTQLYLFFALVVSAAFRIAQAEDRMSTIVRSAEAQLEEGRAVLDEGTLITARDIFEDCTRRDAKNARCYYDMGRTDSYIADVRERDRDKRAAQQTIDSAIESTRHSIDLNAGFADAHALLAELYGRKIGYGGVFSRVCEWVPKPRQKRTERWNWIPMTRGFIS